MKYYWNVASEVLRLSTPIVGTFREVVEDLKYGGYDIPKKWKFYWNAPTTHTDPSLFPKNEIFDPSRYDDGGPHSTISLPTDASSSRGLLQFLLGHRYKKVGSLVVFLVVLCWIGSSTLAHSPGFSLAWKKEDHPAESLVNSSGQGIQEKFSTRVRIQIFPGALELV